MGIVEKAIANYSQFTMTLIARIRKDGVPVYVGDLLLSREGETRQPISIPVADDINSKLPLGTSWSIVGTRQKLNIINDRLVVAWAGHQVQARVLAKEIRDAVAAGATSYKEICRVIEGVEERDRNDVALIGTALTPDQQGIRLEHFSYAADKATIGSTELVAAGTGADDLLRLLPQFAEAVPEPSDNPRSRLSWGFQAALLRWNVEDPPPGNICASIIARMEIHLFGSKH